MHLKVMQQMTVVPRSVGVPPLSDANFEQVLMTNAMMIQQHQQQQQQQQQQQLQRYSAGLPMNGNNNNTNTLDGLSTSSLPIPLPSTQFLPLPPPPPAQRQAQQCQLSFTSLLAMGEDDGRINPLAGMGLSDEQYNMILQNLVNGERFMGMGMMDGGGFGNIGAGMKRRIDDDVVGFASDERGGKRSRLEVIE